MAHNAEAFKCETCQWGRHCDETRPAPYAQWSIRGVIESNVCLLPMITQESRFLLKMHEHYRNKVLPHSGGILDQPNYYAEAMEILALRDSEILAERHKRERQSSVQLGGGNGLRSMREG